jgi:hypothetical protein
MLAEVSGLPQARSSSVSAARTRAECGADASRITAASVAIASLVRPRAISLTFAGIFSRPEGFPDCPFLERPQVSEFGDLLALILQARQLAVADLETNRLPDKSLAA